MNRLKQISCLSIWCVLLLTGCSRDGKHSEATADTVTNDLPGLFIVKTDGSQVSIRQLKRKTILVLFQPDCDHCQREAQQIREHLGAFNDYHLYFISSSPMEAIREFSNEYKLSQIPNVHFGWTPAASITENFGSISAPSLYIYDEHGRIVRIFNGETAINEVLKSI